MAECFDLLDKATVFSTLGANIGYWQIEIENADKDTIAFTSHHNLSHFISMPLALRNDPGTFQRTMEMIFSSVKRQLELAYL